MEQIPLKEHSRGCQGRYNQPALVGEAVHSLKIEHYPGLSRAS
jgi:hypothetical protein